VKVGYCFVEYLSECIIIHEIVISPDFQGKGYGSKVLRSIIDVAAEKHIPIKLQVLKENIAHDLYCKLGFKDVGTTDTHIEMEFIPKDV